MTEQLGLLSNDTSTKFSPPLFHQGDAFDWLASLPNESVDLVITDFPYESLELHRSKGTTTRLKVSEGSSNEWFPVIKNERLPDLIRLIYRALKPDRHFYLFCDEPTADVIKEQQFFHAWQDGAGPRRNSDGSFPCVSGFKLWKSMAWVKSTKDRSRPYGGTGYHYRAAKEWILFFEKGRRKLNDLGLTDVFLDPRVSDGYPTEKPYPVVEALVTNSTEKGELVVDPFSGSWVTAHAALANGRRAAGNDVADLSLKTGHERLKAFENLPQTQTGDPLP